METDLNNSQNEKSQVTKSIPVQSATQNGAPQEKKEDFMQRNVAQNGDLGSMKPPAMMQGHPFQNQMNMMNSGVGQPRSNIK